MRRPHLATNPDPLVAVIITSYNEREFIQECVESVISTDYRNFNIMIVDDRSTDGSYELLEALYKNNSRITLIRNSENRGPAYARNVGVKRSNGKYVAFLSHDTIVESDWLRKVVSMMEADPTIGACQLKLFVDRTCKILDNEGTYFSHFGFLIERDGNEVDRGQFDRIEEIFSGKAAAMVFRKDTLDAIGPLDEDYFMYMEETDLCWRVWLSGKRIVFAPQAPVYHAYRGEKRYNFPSKKLTFLVKYHGTKNYIMTNMKNLELTNLLKILPIHVTVWFVLAIYFVSKRRLYDANLITKGIFWNISHFDLVWSKRKEVQGKVRKVPDKAFMPRILKRMSINYMLTVIKRF